MGKMMDKIRLLLLVVLLPLLACCGERGVVKDVNVTPEPVFGVQREGSFTLRANPAVRVVNVGQNSATVKYIMKSMRQARMYPRLVAVSMECDVELRVNDTVNSELGKEGYLLEVRSNGIRLSANTEQGLFYAFQTLLQLFPADVTAKRYSSVTMPECTILDYPRFAWRGLYVNQSGHPLLLKELKRLVDVMAAYKMNRLCVDGIMDSLQARDLETLRSYAEEHWVIVEDAEWGMENGACVAYGLREGLDSAREGVRTIIEPLDWWDFSRYQADPRYQPRADDGVITLRRSYEFDPVPIGTNGHVATNVVGGQCRLLTDCIGGGKEAEYMLLPRLLAVGESLWSPREKHDWSRFRRKVEVEKDRLSERGFHFCEGSFTPHFTARRLDETTMNISIETEVPNTYIFYTTDGTMPTRQSSIYLGPVNLARGTHIKLLPVYKGDERDSVYEFVIK